MSTVTETLYRPIKIQDIKDLGFEFDGDSESCIKIHKDKIQEQINDHKMAMGAWGYPVSTDGGDFYYLHIFSVVDRKGQDSTWGFTRYGGNTPAANYLIESLHKLGYKMKVEGCRYNYDSDMAYKQHVRDFFEKVKKDLAK
jgi:hypothetical protein